MSQASLLLLWIRICHLALSAVVKSYQWCVYIWSENVLVMLLAHILILISLGDSFFFFFLITITGSARGLE